MKVLHVSSAKSWRGGEQQIAYLVKGLNILGAQQWLLCPKNAPLGERILTELAPGADNQLQVSTYQKRSSISMAAAREIHKICTTHNIDVIQLHDSHAHTAGVLAHTIWGVKVPMVLTRRVIFPAAENFLSKWKYNHPSIKAIVCISEAVKKEMGKVIRDNQKLKIIGSAVDIQKYENLAIGELRSHLQLDDQSMIVGGIGALDVDKNFSLFLKIAAHISREKPNAHFVIIGKDEGQKDLLMQEAQFLGIDKKVHFLGFQNYVPSLLVDFDVFLFTSKREGLGTSVLEAMAANVPVVVSDSGGVRDIVSNGKNGFIVDFSEKEIAFLMAQKTISLLEDSRLRLDITSKAKQTVLDFSFDKMALAYQSLYNSII